jgi:hypothetical protein
MGTLKFAYRSSATHTNARYGGGGITGVSLSNTTAISSASDGGALSGYLTDLTATGGAHAIVFPGRDNTPASRSQSYLIRVKINYTGSPAANRCLFSLGYGGSTLGPVFQMWHTSTGNLVAYCKNEVNQIALSSTSFGAWSPTSGTYYDIVFKWDGTTTANAAKVYIDNSLLGQATASFALTASWTSLYYNVIVLGYTPSVNTSAYYLDEFVIWDGDQDTSATTLVSGSGALNGASRTSLVDAAAFDGSSYTDPGEASVKTGTAYTYNGSAKTGTYTGSDRWTDPGIANVRTGTAYKADSTTNNRTGTCAVPTAAETKTGVSVDATTGTYTGSDRWTDPGEANVADGVAYKADSTTNNKLGTLETPPEAVVLDGYAYGVAQTGTLKTGGSKYVISI